MAKQSIETLDRRIKWGLLICSSITLVLLAASALQENVLEEWRTYRRDYAKILLAKATDEKGQAIARQFEVIIAQNVLPELGTIDRCITCHTGLDDPRMKDQANPFRTHPGTILESHPPEEFGCTVCHQGQGRATKADDAHGHMEDWPYPKLLNRFLYSSCGQCHDEQDLFAEDSLLEKVGGGRSGVAQIMIRGKRFVDEKGCLGCHTLNGRGGTLGPDITYVGDKTRHDFDFSHFGKDEPHEVAYWLRKHFLEPNELSPGTVMPDLGLSKQDADALTAYVLSLKERKVSRTYRATVRMDAATPKPATGKELYMLMCAACHGPDGRASEVPGIRTPALNNVDALAVASDDYYRHIIDKGRSNTAMPPWGPDSENLSYEEIDRVVAHIRSWQPEGADPTHVSSTVGDAAMGRAYYRGLCANCHGGEGQGGIGNALNSPTFLAIASDQFLAETIIHGRPGTAMASWKHLPAQAVSDLLAYIRTRQATAPSFENVKRSMARYSRDDNAKVGAVLYKGNCATCHGTNGEGGIGPRLNSHDILPIVDDKYLYRTITEGRPTTAMPAWRHLSADNIAALIVYMRSWNGHRSIQVEVPPARGDYDLGEVHYRLSCLGCHGDKARGGVGPQLNNPAFLSAASDSILYQWIAHGRTGTAMKGFLSDEQGVTEMKPNQIADVIAYLRHLGSRDERPTMRTGIGNPFLGGQLYAGNCASCHGADGEGASGPQLNNPTFLRTASDGFLAATIAMGRTNTPMRSMVRGQEGVGQLDPRNVQDIISFIRLWDVPDPWRKPRAIAEMSERAIRSGKETFAHYCAGCHGTTGKGIEDGPGYFAPALNNPEFLGAASDGFLLATIARGRSNSPMRPFGKGAGGIAGLDAGTISDVVSYIRTWQEGYKAQGDEAS